MEHLDEGTTRRERIKRHVVKHKTKYAVGASSISCLSVGILTGMQFRNPPEMLQIVKPKQVMTLAYKCSQEMTTIILQAKGDPGDVVERLSDGKRWPSKGDLARELGVQRSAVSKYFAGDIPNLLDEQYKVIGKAGHAIPVPA